MELVRISHCVYHCEYHIVIVTKYRRKVFNAGTFAYFSKKLAEVSEHYPLLKIRELNHDRDHIHMQITIPPTMGVGKAVGIIKQNTARGMKQKFVFLKEVYWGTDSIWSDGYYVSTIGLNESMIREYIEEQGRKDLGQT